jgi:hypothetical protein
VQVCARSRVEPGRAQRPACYLTKLARPPKQSLAALSTVAAVVVASPTTADLASSCEAGAIGAAITAPQTSSPKRADASRRSGLPMMVASSERAEEDNEDAPSPSLADPAPARNKCGLANLLLVPLLVDDLVVVTSARTMAATARRAVTVSPTSGANDGVKCAVSCSRVGRRPAIDWTGRTACARSRGAISKRNGADDGRSDHSRSQAGRPMSTQRASNQ